VAGERGPLVGYDISMVKFSVFEGVERFPTESCAIPPAMLTENEPAPVQPDIVTGAYPVRPGTALPLMLVITLIGAREQVLQVAVPLVVVRMQAGVGPGVTEDKGAAPA